MTYEGGREKQEIKDRAISPEAVAKVQARNAETLRQ